MTTAKQRALFGARLRAARKAAGFKNTDYAEKIGVTFNAPKTWERGEYFPHVEQLLKLTHLLGVSLSYFFEGIEGVPVTDGPTPGERVSKVRTYTKAGTK